MATMIGPFQYAFDCKCSNILEMIPYCITLRAAMQEFCDDASQLLNHPKSVFPDIPIQESNSTTALFNTTDDPELDGMTIIAMQLILQNWLILFEKQACEYLAGGQFGSSEMNREDFRNVPLTNRCCEAAMGMVDREVSIRPNVTPGYVECRLVMKGSNLFKTLHMAF